LVAEYRRATPSKEVARMARRSTPDRIYHARRAGTIRRLEAEGELPDRAEALVIAWEFEAAEDGRERDGRWWEDAWRWIAQRRAG
jgi:hypothetical protein